jgi:hypothetical protein
VSHVVRVYVNERPVEVVSGSSALDAVRAWNDEIAAQVAAGDRALTDSRGLPIAPDTPLIAGTIIRVVSARQKADRSPEA